ncbi:MAG: hypothetical protein LQ338_007966 [Usnochroma carphineum]|nr:MAG: hypothetical protein LQ338_007966 [Usnochroma carphineum]
MAEAFLSGYDAPFHLSEECSNANIASPRAIVLTSGVGGVFGWFLQLVVAYTVVDIEAALDSDLGQPYAAYLQQVLPQKVTMAILALTIICAFSMGQGCMVAASRVTFAYSRDECFGPLSRITKQVNQHTRTPVNAVWFNTLIGIAMDFLIFGGALAAGALFSIGAVAAFVAFTIPIFIRVFFVGNRFRPGPWHLGRASRPIGALACAFVLLMFPILLLPSVTGSDLEVNIEHRILGDTTATLEGLKQDGEISSTESSRQDKKGLEVDKADSLQTVLKRLSHCSSHMLLLPRLFYLLPYLRNRLIRDVPGPLTGRFSNLWLPYQSQRGRRYLAVDAAHKRYLKLLPTQPDHVAMADPEAIPIIYSHTGGGPKAPAQDSAADPYDAAAITTMPSIPSAVASSTFVREPSILAKEVPSHTHSAPSRFPLEPFMQENLKELVNKQWERISDAAIGAGERYADMDRLHWFNYTAIDIVGDFYLLLQAPAKTLAKSASRQTALLHTLQLSKSSVTVAKSRVLSRLLPRPQTVRQIHLDPFFRNGLRAVENLAGIPVARVNEGLAAQEKGVPQGNDLLARLMEGKDEDGNKLGREELIAEALTQLITGTDITSNTSCALLYRCTRTPRVMERLREDINGAVPDYLDIPSFESAKDLP